LLLRGSVAGISATSNLLDRLWGNAFSDLNNAAQITIFIDVDSSKNAFFIIIFFLREKKARVEDDSSDTIWIVR